MIVNTLNNGPYCKVLPLVSFKGIQFLKKVWRINKLIVIQEKVYIIQYNNI